MKYMLYMYCFNVLDNNVDVLTCETSGTPAQIVCYQVLTRGSILARISRTFVYLLITVCTWYQGGCVFVYVYKGVTMFSRVGMSIYMLLRISVSANVLFIKSEILNIRRSPSTRTCIYIFCSKYLNHRQIIVTKILKIKTLTEGT